MMTREFEQQRHADSLVLLDLPQHDGWDIDEVESAISLAATICVEQTRASSGGHYLLGIAADESRIIVSRSPGGFREEALDALAECGPSSKADLDHLLNTLCAQHSLNDERLILITPRPKDAAAAIARVSSVETNSSLDLIGRTTIITALAADLKDVFRCDPSRQSPQTPTEPMKQNVESTETVSTAGKVVA